MHFLTKFFCYGALFGGAFKLNNQVNLITYEVKSLCLVLFIYFEHLYQLVLRVLTQFLNPLLVGNLVLIVHFEAKRTMMRHFFEHFITLVYFTHYI